MRLHTGVRFVKRGWAVVSNQLEADQLNMGSTRILFLVAE
jgi:hypothetical protein